MAGGEGESAAAPLLEEKPQVYVDGCPGCAVDRRKAENPGIPYKHFFHIWIIILVSCASYMLGRALTSTAWGMVADRIGRKPVIVLAILSTSASWAIGLILGPAIGGYLAQPTEKYPELFPPNSVFGRTSRSQIRRRETGKRRIRVPEEPAVATRSGRGRATVGDRKGRRIRAPKEPAAAALLGRRRAAVGEGKRLWICRGAHRRHAVREGEGHRVIGEAEGCRICPRSPPPPYRLGGEEALGSTPEEPAATALSPSAIGEGKRLGCRIRSRGARRCRPFAERQRGRPRGCRPFAGSRPETGLGERRRRERGGAAWGARERGGRAGVVWGRGRGEGGGWGGDQMVFFLLGIVVFIELVWTFKPFLAVAEQIPSS
ncbi:hypothetical protein PR202_ga04101 [Eleusine coracana subsp. coracana]|uniref:Major facilitator superfamily (MFS) profile domain-containing protein n=1 Tax=Eleusine coracana subsp. coracana TaxID=191504 RepID=A0AAV5BRF9_ELECO|nr:hypothetical protein PR202_ga04101 [Eleusine coracana subsp. coracana]